MNREDLTYFLFVNSKLNELLYREDLQKLAEEDNPIYMTFKDGRQNCLLPSEQIFWHLGKEDNPIIILME